MGCEEMGRRSVQRSEAVVFGGVAVELLQPMTSLCEFGSVFDLEERVSSVES